MKKLIYLMLTLTLIISQAYSDKSFKEWYAGDGGKKIFGIGTHVYTPNKYTYTSKHFNILFELKDGKTVTRGDIKYLSDYMQKEMKMKSVSVAQIKDGEYEWTITKNNGKIKKKKEKHKNGAYFVNILPFIFSSELSQNNLKNDFDKSIVISAIQKDFELNFTLENKTKDEILEIAKKNKFVLPQQLKNKLEMGSSSYKVITMKVKPPLNAIIKSKFYYIFDGSSPAIYFGGKPKEADYIVFGYDTKYE